MIPWGSTEEEERAQAVLSRMYPSVSFPLQDELQFARSKETEENVSTTVASQIDLPYGENVSNIVQQLEPAY